MNKEEIKKALECCDSTGSYVCDDCPYYYDDGCRDKLQLGALDLINEQEKDYSKLQEMFANYQLASDKEIRAQVKQTKIDMLNKMKDYINQLACEEYGDNACDINYITVDIDKFEQDIDELIKEIEK